MAAIIALSVLTWLFPFLACVLTYFQRERGNVLAGSDDDHDKTRQLSLAILIPVSNGMNLLDVTLRSVKAASASFQSKNPRCKVSIFVGLDGCSDGSELVARDAGATAIVSSIRIGKWRMLKLLVEESQADWVALVDAGTVWPTNLLSAAFAGRQPDNLVCIAPSYRPASKSSLMNMLWKIERLLKLLENFAGGPIAVHGATAFYRRDKLQYAFAHLGNVRWWNDDVVLPLSLRLQDAANRTIYLPKVCVQDYGESALEVSWKGCLSEFYRRQRMALGNLQWMSSTFKTVWNNNLVLVCLVLRRIFRLLWAYCGVVIVLGLMTFLNLQFSFHAVVVLSLIFLTLGAWTVLLKPNSLRQISSVVFAALNSLFVPIYFFFLNRIQVVWQ